tara:strand:- start:1892 stop:2452 length:561 start_codon:yes stop_codon:yes gene_type:complete
MEIVTRKEIIDYVTYEEQRNQIRSQIMVIKEQRRINVGGILSFLFENKDTVRYQIQEMIRVEKIVKEEDILHEINTYNEILGKSGELGCTLLIEIDNPDERDEKLSTWIDLPNHIFLKLEDGEKIFAKFDTRQIGNSRLSSVQYIKFNTGGRIPISIGSDFKLFEGETMLSLEQKKALAQDLGMGN